MILRSGGKTINKFKVYRIALRLDLKFYLKDGETNNDDPTKEILSENRVTVPPANITAPTIVYSKAHNKEEKKARAQKKIQDRAIAAAAQMISSYPSGDP